MTDYHRLGAWSRRRLVGTASTILAVGIRLGELFGLGAWRRRLDR